MGILETREVRISHRFDDAKWLRMKNRPKMPQTSQLRCVDLFAGGGGMTLGVMEACRRMGLGHVIEWANEWDEDALSIFKKNLKPKEASSLDICDVFDGDHELKGKNRITPLTTREGEFIDKFPNTIKPDLLTGGPPCQGHSNLNNHTRRDDPRNHLYFRMIRAAQVLDPNVIMIENVAEVVHSKQNVIQKSSNILKKMGYYVDDMIVRGVELGVPQNRKRHFLLASKKSKPDFSILDEYKVNAPRTLRWAIYDLKNIDRETAHPFDTPAAASTENVMRMTWLVENDEYNLPDSLRPDCHRLKEHTYKIVYGRMRWDEPSSTIFTGFRCNGRGRFTHPDALPGRALTSHEGARIQTFPDWFSFEGHKITTMSKVIGNALPPLLSMHVSHLLIRSMLKD